MQEQPPQATFTAGGICHNMPLEGHPVAGDIVVRAGVPAAPVRLGTVGGRPVVLDVMSLDEMDEIEAALLTARIRLMMWHQDHAPAPALTAVPPLGSAA